MTPHGLHVRLLALHDSVTSPKGRFSCHQLWLLDSERPRKKYFPDVYLLCFLEQIHSIITLILGNGITGPQIHSSVKVIKLQGSLAQWKDCHLKSPLIYFMNNWKTGAWKSKHKVVSMRFWNIHYLAISSVHIACMYWNDALYSINLYNYHLLILKMIIKERKMLTALFWHCIQQI